MTKARLLAAAVVTCSLTLGLTAGVAQAIELHQSWHLVYKARSLTLLDVSAAGPNNAWAVGSTGTGDSAKPALLHWNGTQWSRETAPFPSGLLPTSVDALSPGDVWVIDNQLISPAPPEALIYGPAGWRTLALPADTGTVAPTGLTGAWGSTGMTCTTVGTKTTCSTGFWHWNGTAFTLYQMPGTDLITAVRGHAWVMQQHGFPSRVTMYYWTGTKFAPMASPPPYYLGPQAQITASPNGHVWIVGFSARRYRPGLLFFWNGSSWSSQWVPRNLDWGSWGFISDDHRGVWLGPFAHWTGRRWVNLAPTSLTSWKWGLQYVTGIPYSASAWSVGSYGTSSASLPGVIALTGATP